MKEENNNNNVIIEINNTSNNKSNNISIKNKNHFENNKNNINNNVIDGNNNNIFFINDYNDCILVNLDNNKEYSTPEIENINLKKSQISSSRSKSKSKEKYKNPIKNKNYNNLLIQINDNANSANNNENDIIDDEEDEKMNDIKNFEANGKISKSYMTTEVDKDEKEQRKYKIFYKIFKNMKMPINSLEKNSLDGTIEEIISRQFLKIHNNYNERNKKRLDKAYNMFQKEKSQNNGMINFSMYNNENDYNHIRSNYNSNDKKNGIYKKKISNSTSKPKVNYSNIVNKERSDINYKLKKEKKKEKLRDFTE